VGATRIITKDDIQTALNVSLATVNNWIKTGVIPKPDERNMFTEGEFESIITRIVSGNSSKLKGRANRSMSNESIISFLGLDDDESKYRLLKAIQIHETSRLSIEESLFTLSVLSLEQCNLINPEWCSNPRTEIERFLLSWLSELDKDLKSIISPYHGFHIPQGNNDFLGAFYQSVQSIAQKSQGGSYYTPYTVLNDIDIPTGKTILDPCCGSGGILLKILRREHDPSHVYVYDIDPLALKICRINLTQFFADPNASPHIDQRDIVFDEQQNGDLFSVKHEVSYDFIITNPPWGSKFTREQKSRIVRMYPSIYSTESFAIALFNCIQKLSDHGSLIFFLPYSFLNVSTHKTIRRFVIHGGFAITIRLLGNVFKGVMSEGIRLHLDKSQERPKWVKIRNGKTDAEYLLPLEHVKAPDYLIPATVNSSDADIIEKVYSKPHLLLKGNAKFALGVVTGDNKKHLLKVPTAKSEPIYRGKDIEAFTFKDPTYYIEFDPGSYQQVAPLDLYRQRKIAYRFISDRLLCALDSCDRLLLNSANLFIPTIDYPWETIVSLFNSSLYAILYRKKFASKKILRSHIESMPLPILSSQEHAEIGELYRKCVADIRASNELDNLIYCIFNLSQNDRQTIEGAI